MIPLGLVLTVSAILFGLGLFGALVRTNAVRILLAIELMLNAVNLNLVAFSRYVGGAEALAAGGAPGAGVVAAGGSLAGGQVFALMVMAVAAAEAAVGLAIVLMIVRHRDAADVERINLLKW